MFNYFKKPSTIILSILLGLNCSAGFAQNPFANDTAVTVDESSGDDSQGSATNVVPEYKENKNINNEYPIEGTINCRYGQNCRTSPWGDIIAILPPGTKVVVTGKEGDWYTIEYNGRKCYLHYSLVDTPLTPAYDGYHPYAYADINFNYKKDQVKKTTTKKQSTNNNNNNSNKKIDTTKDINGPEVPECLMKGLEAAKKSIWNKTNDKCLQFAGTLAEEAGAPVSKKGAGSQPQIAWSNTKDTSLRGQRIDCLKEAALSKKLLPGMLIHVKHHYNEDPDYKRSNDGHHWFVYMGLVNGEPMFVDNIKENKLRNTETQARTFKTSKYGDRYITAIYDPFASQR